MRPRGVRRAQACNIDNRLTVYEFICEHDTASCVANDTRAALSQSLLIALLAMKTLLNMGEQLCMTMAAHALRRLHSNLVDSHACINM